MRPSCLSLGPGLGEMIARTPGIYELEIQEVTEPPKGRGAAGNLGPRTILDECRRGSFRTDTLLNP
jgi:hypothetical protein